VNLTSTFQALSRLYPTDFREMFGAEMLRTFEHAAEAGRQAGPAAFRRFLAREAVGLICGAASEWFARFSTGRTLVDRCPQQTAAVKDQTTDLEREISLAINQMVHAIATHDFPAAPAYSNRERVAREKLRLLQEAESSRTALSNRFPQRSAN
jgi:hypothetical protein